MNSASLLELALTSLDDSKARDIEVLDVRGITTMADYLLIASGTSERHVRSIAEKLMETVKPSGYDILGSEGLTSGEWVLVDLNDLIVHVMQPRTREFYKLEDLWSVGSKPETKHAGK